MGIVSKILGGGTASAVEAVGNVVTGIFGDKGEKLTHEEVMARLAMSPQLAQLEINKVEAGHRSIFVAGWRPAIGWICATGLAVKFVGNPVLAALGYPTIDASALDELTPLVVSLLGLAGYRTMEKLGGKAK